uniref:Uncharacterized protein n=1 Tax=Arundo donax TaxID=35708 RepID=A0A0A9CB69_ARUDO
MTLNNMSSCIGMLRCSTWRRCHAFFTLTL